jgi:catechol 2,3-dioxygenase-like lactoylglutathione lyase family enzyme
MTKTTISEEVTHRWYARPVLFVADLDRALQFYIDLLGFEKAWREGDGRGGVCQVHRAECEIILCQDAARRDKGRLFVELTRDGLAELRREMVERSVPNEMCWWGYDSIKVVDPDRNELLFPISE